MAILTGTARNRFAGFPEPDKDGALKGITSGIVGFFESLARYSNQFEASYVEDGFYETPAIVSPDTRPVSQKLPAQRRHITQRPKATVFVKKKQFAALSSNNELRMLDEDERLYLRCVKALFRRKCDEIAFHESLVNIESIYETNGFLITDDLLDNSMEYIITVLGSIASASAVVSALSSNAAIGGAEGNAFDSFLAFLRNLYAAKQKNDRSRASAFTRWVDDPTEADYAGLGPGTGTIELNMVTSISSSCGLRDSSASLSIEDPYQLMLITAADIETAIYMATSRSYQISSFFDATASFRLALAHNADRKLNASRSARRQKEIDFEFVENEFGKMSPAATLGYIDVERTKYYQWINGITDAASKAEAKEIGITAEEIVLINQVTANLREYRDAITVPSTESGIESLMNSEDDVRKISKLREKMRRDFLGQHLVQPMDQVTIFANSNTNDITPVGGIVDVVTGAAATLTDMLDPELISQERKDIFGGDDNVGLDFLYNSIRKKNVFRDDGACIFSGLADSVDDTYEAQSGQFRVSVQCVSNLEYLKISRYTVKPDLNNTLGTVRDPLTPFDLDSAVDPGTGLIVSEGPELSQKNKERLDFLRIPSGPLVSKKLRGRDDIISDKRNGLAIISHTPGLVYKWKEGIVSATLDASGGGGEFGGLSALSQPFAKLDAANIASILITGQPYDYATFLEGVSKVSGTSSNPTNLSRDFFNYLFEHTDRVKKYYGNFIPAKDRSMDTDAVIASYDAKNAISNLNTRANRLAADLDRLRRNQSAGSSSPQDQKKIEDEILEISNRIAEMQSGSGLALGTQISLEGNNVFVLNESRTQTDREIVYKTKRKPEDVRFNKDNNYFIVSSDYDTDFVIQAFVANINGDFDLFNADYTSPHDTIQNAAGALQLEFFADPDGNIVLRPPRYNRTPLSLMNELMRQTPPGQVSFLPNFVKNVLGSRERAVKDAILKNELRIAKDLYSIGLSVTTSAGKEGIVKPLLTHTRGASLFELDMTAVFKEMAGGSGTGGTTSNFVFGPASRVATKEEAVKQSTAEMSNIQQMLRDVIIKIKVLGGEAQNDVLIKKAEAEAVAALAKLKLENARGFISAKISAISGYLNNRKSLLRSLNDIIKRGGSVEQEETAGLAALSLLGTNAQSALGMLGSMFNFGLSPALESLVENDLTNMDGPGSGKRFIISDSVVIRGSFSHRPPEYNAVSVCGAQDFLAGENGTIGGLPAIIAHATDFDSWRQYGFRELQGAIRRPEMTSAETQCAPFASLMLTTQRKKIHSGSITIVGNEYYRPGDNVYLSYRNMIYYVTDIRHSINLNSGDFTTELTLSYGRPPGEIIPTPIDIIGAAPSGAAFLTNKYRKEGSQDKSVKQTAKGRRIFNLGTVHLTPGIKSRVTDDPIFKNELKSIILKTNKMEIESAVIKARARAIISPTGAGVSSNIEVRGYYVAGAQDAKKSSAEVCCAVIQELINQQMTSGGPAPGSAEADAASRAVGQAPATPTPGSTSAVNVKIRLVDISADFSDEERLLLPFPSEDAWLSTSPVSLDGGRKVDLPVNAFDIVFIT